MGDYNKLIVSCSIKKDAKEKLETRLEEFELYYSAYQSSEQIIDMKEDGEELNIILIGQRKWGDGIDEFCEWLRPYVTQGSGQDDCFAMNFSEYGPNPKLYFKDESGEDK